MKLKLKLKKKPNSGPQEETKSSCVSIPDRRSAILTRADIIIRKNFRKPVEDGPNSDPETCLLQLPQYILNFDPKQFKKRKHSQESDSELHDQNIPPKKCRLIKHEKPTTTAIVARTEIKEENDTTCQKSLMHHQINLNLKQDPKMQQQQQQQQDQAFLSQKDVDRHNIINSCDNNADDSMDINIDNHSNQKMINSLKNRDINMDNDFNHESPQGPLESKQTVETSVLTDTKHTQTTSFDNDDNNNNDKNTKNQSNQFNQQQLQQQQQQIVIKKCESNNFQSQTLPILTLEKSVQTVVKQKQQQEEDEKSRKIDQSSQEFKSLLEKEVQEYVSRQKKLEDELAQKQKTITRLQKLRQCAKLRQADASKEASMKFLQDQVRAEMHAWKEQFQIDWVTHPHENARDVKRRTDEMLKQSGVHDKSIIHGLTASVMFISLAKSKTSQMVVKQTGDMLYRWFVDPRMAENYNNQQLRPPHYKSDQRSNTDPQKSEQRIAMLRVMLERIVIMCQAWWLHHEQHDKIFKEEGANANLNQANNNNLNHNNFRNGNGNGNANMRQNINVDAFILQRRESCLQKLKRNSDSFRKQVDQQDQDWGVLYLMNIFCQHLGAQCMHISVCELAWRVEQFRQGLKFLNDNNWEQPGQQQQQLRQQQGELDDEFDGNAVVNGMR